MIIESFFRHVASINESGLNTIKTGDVYNILNTESIEYSACVVELMGARRQGGILTHQFRITVVDKVKDDDSNILDAFDQTETILNDIIIHIEDAFDISEDYSIEFVDENFADRCAGCYALIDVYGQTDYCPAYTVDDGD